MNNTNFPNIDFGFRRGSAAGLNNVPITNGVFSVAKDTEKLFIDIDGKRISISDIVYGYTAARIRALTKPSNKIYLASDTLRLYKFNFTTLRWEIVNNRVDYANYATFDQLGNVIDSTYLTRAEANIQYQNLLDIINSYIHYDYELFNSVDELPEVGKKGIIYLTPIEDEDVDNLFEERIWIEYMVEVDPPPIEDPESGEETPPVENNPDETQDPENPGEIEEELDNEDTSEEGSGEDDLDDSGEMEEELDAQAEDDGEDIPPQPMYEIRGNYEIVGTTRVDLSNYYTKDEVNAMINDLRAEMEGKINAAKDTINTSIAGLTETSNVLSGRLTTVEGSATTNSNDIGTLKGRVSNTETTGTTNSANISALTTRVSSNADKITVNTTDITSLKARLTAVEDKNPASSTEVTSIRSDIEALKNDVDRMDKVYLEASQPDEDKYSEIISSDIGTDVLESQTEEEPTTPDPEVEPETPPVEEDPNENNTEENEVEEEL